MWEGLKGALTAKAVPVQLLRGTKDLWVRDFCPIQIDRDRFVKFRYQPDYLEGYEDRMTGESVCRSIPYLQDYIRSSINLDGGNVIAAPTRVILTKKVVAENPEYHRQSALRKELERLFQVDECIFIPKEPFDLIGHSDGIVRFINDETVLVNDYSGIDKDYGRRLRTVLTKHRFEIEELPYFIENKREQGIDSAVGCFINYLRTENVIVMPTFGTRHDDNAICRLEKLFPGTPVVPLRCEELACKGGVLNCCTWSLRTS